MKDSTVIIGIYIWNGKMGNNINTTSYIRDDLFTDIKDDSDEDTISSNSDFPSLDVEESKISKFRKSVELENQTSPQDVTLYNNTPPLIRYIGCFSPIESKGDVDISRSFTKSSSSLTGIPVCACQNNLLVSSEVTQRVGLSTNSVPTYEGRTLDKSVQSPKLDKSAQLPKLDKPGQSPKRDKSVQSTKLDKPVHLDKSSQSLTKSLNGFDGPTKTAAQRRKCPNSGYSGAPKSNRLLGRIIELERSFTMKYSEFREVFASRPNVDAHSPEPSLKTSDINVESLAFDRTEIPPDSPPRMRAVDFPQANTVKSSSFADLLAPTNTRSLDSFFSYKPRDLERLIENKALLSRDSFMKYSCARSKLDLRSIQANLLDSSNVSPSKCTDVHQRYPEWNDESTWNVNKSIDSRWSNSVTMSFKDEAVNRESIISNIIRDHIQCLCEESSENAKGDSCVTQSLSKSDKEKTVSSNIYDAAFGDSNPYRDLLAMSVTNDSAFVDVNSESILSKTGDKIMPMSSIISESGNTTREDLVFSKSAEKKRPISSGNDSAHGDSNTYENLSKSTDKSVPTSIAKFDSSFGNSHEGQSNSKINKSDSSILHSPRLFNFPEASHSQILDLERWICTDLISPGNLKPKDVRSTVKMETVLLGSPPLSRFRTKRTFGFSAPVRTDSSSKPQVKPSMYAPHMNKYLSLINHTLPKAIEPTVPKVKYRYRIKFNILS